MVRGLIHVKYILQIFKLSLGPSLHFTQRKTGGTYVWEICDIGVTRDYVRGLVDYACVDDHDVGKLGGES